MVLFNCLASYLIADFGDQINWALCPESENCICRKNLTQKGNFMVKCLTIEEQREWCPQVRNLHLLCRERDGWGGGGREEIGKKKNINKLTLKSWGNFKFHLT